MEQNELIFIYDCFWALSIYSNDWFQHIYIYVYIYIEIKAKDTCRCIDGFSELVVVTVFEMCFVIFSHSITFNMFVYENLFVCVCSCVIVFCICQLPVYCVRYNTTTCIPLHCLHFTKHYVYTTLYECIMLLLLLLFVLLLPTSGNENTHTVKWLWSLYTIIIKSFVVSIHRSAVSI